MSDLYKKVLFLTEECRITITEMCKQAGVTRSILSEFGAGRTKREAEQQAAKHALILLGELNEETP